MKSSLSEKYYRNLGIGYREFDTEEIKSDFSLLLKLLFNLIVFILLFVPRLFLGIFFLLFDTYKSKEYFSKITSFPFQMVREIVEWFFQAKITATLILSLIVIFIFQYIYINPNEVLLNSLMTHTNHLFEGNYYSILTSVFLHGNLVHLLSNCFALLIFGRIVERQFHFSMLWIFLASGVISNIISNLVSNFQGLEFYSLGASGGIAGLIIFAIMLSPFAISTAVIIPLPLFVLGWFLISLDIIGLTNPNSTTNHLAHLGGYLALLLLFFFLEIRHREKIIVGFITNVLIIVLIGFLLKILGISLETLLFGFF